MASVADGRTSKERVRTGGCARRRRTSPRRSAAERPRRSLRRARRRPRPRVAEARIAARTRSSGPRGVAARRAGGVDGGVPRGDLAVNGAVRGERRSFTARRSPRSSRPAHAAPVIRLHAGSQGRRGALAARTLCALRRRVLRQARADERARRASTTAPRALGAGARVGGRCRASRSSGVVCVADAGDAGERVSARRPRWTRRTRASGRRRHKSGSARARRVPRRAAPARCAGLDATARKRARADPTRRLSARVSAAARARGRAIEAERGVARAPAAVRRRARAAARSASGDARFAAARGARRAFGRSASADPRRRVGGLAAEVARRSARAAAARSPRASRALLSERARSLEAGGRAATRGCSRAPAVRSHARARRT